MNFQSTTHALTQRKDRYITIRKILIQSVRKIHRTFLWLAVLSFVVISCNAPEAFTPTPTPPPSPTATPAPPTSAEIFTSLSPSVAFVDTPAGSGSGLLISNGYIVTNAHVVWPFDKVRIVFPDGEEYTDIPVLNWDLLGDLAVLGPIETDVAPVKLENGEDLVIGSEVFLIGYPGEVDKFPQPTITRGIISRFRQWDPTGVTYFQTDATIGGGQSGGILVSELGQVIGISNFSFSNAGFGLVASASDVLPRIDSLIAGENLAGLSNRKIPLVGEKLEYPAVSLQHEWDRQVFVVNEPKNTEIKIKVDSSQSDVAFSIWNLYGAEPTYVDNGFLGTETTTFVTKSDIPYFIDLYQKPYGARMSIEADHNLVHFVDIDDGRGIPSEISTNGHLDYPGDIDRFQLNLKAGETVNILVDSLLTDPVLIVGRPGDKEEQLVLDDNSGEGIFGTNAELTFTAPASDTYLIIIGDASGYKMGGYSLQVRNPYEGAPTPMIPEPLPTPIKSEFGAMAKYSSDTAPFSIQYPATWADDPSSFGDWQALCSVDKACFSGDAFMAITEENLSVIGNPTLKEYVDFYVYTLENSPIDVKLISREKFTTMTNLTGEVILLDYGGLLRMKRFIYIYDNIGFNATYIFTADQQKQLDPLTDYSFSTFDIDK